MAIPTPGSDSSEFIQAAGFTFSASEIESFETLLSTEAATEHDASRFFWQYPKFLLLGHGAELRREVEILDHNGRVFRVDFFRRSIGSDYWDVVELKSPQLPFVTGEDSKHPRFSQSVNAAIHQALDYRERIIDTSEVREHLVSRGIRVLRPKILVVAGRDRESVSDDVMAILIDRVRSLGVELLTYDRILAFAKEHYRLHRVIVLPAPVLDLAPSVQDSFRLREGDALWRRIPPYPAYVRMRGDKLQAGRFNFMGRRGDAFLSFSVARLTTRDLQAFSHAGTFGVFEIAAGELMRLGLEIRHAPVPGEYGHVDVTCPRDDETALQIARSGRVIVAPPNTGDDAMPNRRDP